MKSKTYTQSKRTLDLSQSSKFCRAGVKQTDLQNLKKKWNNLLFNGWKDFEHLRKWNFCKTLFFSLWKLFLQLLYIILIKWVNFSFPPTETTVVILKFLSSLFSHISLKLYLGCKKVINLGQFTHEKTKQSFPFGDLFSSTVIFCIHAPLLSFFLSCGYKNWGTRLLQNRG